MFKPLRSNVLLKAQEASQSSISGLIIASAVVNQASVIACGPEVKELKVGDVIRFDKASAVALDGFLMLREADVLCVVE